MSQRQYAVCTAILLAAAANGLVLWNKSRPPHETLAGKERQQVERILEWEAPPAVPLNQSLESIEECVVSLPHDNSQDIVRAAQVPFIQLPSDKRDDLVLATASLLKCYEASSSAALVSYMEGRNERPDNAMLNRVKEEKVADGFGTHDQMESMSDNDFLERVWRWQKCRSFWKSIVSKTGYICIWRCSKPEDAQKGPLGQADGALFRNGTSYAHLFRPEFSFEEALRESGEVLMSDVMVVIEHDQNLKMARSPYFIRFWYCERDKLWHPMSLMQVSTDFGAPGPAVELLF